MLELFAWSGVTVAVYFAAKSLYRWRPRWWLVPLPVTCAVLAGALLLLHVPYGDYSEATHWLAALLGPVTVAFAVPIHQHRALIRKQWRALLLAMLAGSVTSILTGWGLASVLGVSAELRLSLLPRSLSTPFAMSVSGEIGGIPEMTALFVVATGLLGALIGDFLLLVLPLRSALARGALLGVGAHGSGTAKAYEVGAQEGSVAGLTMVLVGLLNVLLAPLLVYLASAF